MTSNIFKFIYEIWIWLRCVLLLAKHDIYIFYSRDLVIKIVI